MRARRRNGRRRASDPLRLWARLSSSCGGIGGEWKPWKMMRRIDDAARDGGGEGGVGGGGAAECWDVGSGQGFALGYLRLKSRVYSPVFPSIPHSPPRRLPSIGAHQTSSDSYTFSRPKWYNDKRRHWRRTKLGFEQVDFLWEDACSWFFA
ncbi:hypothetical protein AKJ16_DCAP01839 [Drosera capensis]